MICNLGRKRTLGWGVGGWEDEGWQNRRYPKKRLLYIGSDCYEYGTFWTIVTTSGLLCYQFSPINNSSRVRGPWTNLHVTMLLNGSNANAAGHNDMHVEIYFVQPGVPFSIQNQKVMKLAVGYHHDIQLEMFKDRFNSHSLVSINKHSHTERGGQHISTEH